MTTATHDPIPVELDDCPTPIRPVDTLDEQIAELKGAARSYCESSAEAMAARTLATQTFTKDARAIRRAKLRRFFERLRLWAFGTYPA